MFASTSPTWRPERFVGVPANGGLVPSLPTLGMPSLSPVTGPTLCVVDAQIEAQYQGKRHNLVGVTSS